MTAVVDCRVVTFLLLVMCCVAVFLRVAVDASAVKDSDEPAKKSSSRTSPQRRILVFGGNGFLGASTVERLIKLGDNVTIVNRGNWYWDSGDRIVPHVTAISCDRKNGVASCSDLVQLIHDTDIFDAVVDFSAYGPKETREATVLLQGKAAMYVHISTDSIYDVCESVRIHHGPTREDEAVRPADPYTRDMLDQHHDYGNRKMQAEEELVGQRKNASGSGKPGIPYVIFRLPDVLGPRDTTYRFWVYQLWIRMAPVLPSRPVTIPKFLVDYNNSFVYVEDVASAIVDAIAAGPTSKYIDEAFNLAWPQNITVERLLRDIRTALGIDVDEPFQTDEESNGLYLYPTVRRGPIDVEKATKAFGWKATPWTEAINATVRFYESAMTDRKWSTQRDEIIQIQTSQLYTEAKEEFFEALEKTYNIDLNHFRPRREEL